MSYTPTEWKTGDIVTSTKLNKLEQGVASAGGGGVLVVNKDKTPPFALDKTWQEIYDAASTGVVFLVSVEDGEISTDLVMLVYADDDTYSLEDSRSVYSTNSASGYPVMTGPINH